MSLRLANLGTLKHPYSVDLYVEKVREPSALCSDPSASAVSIIGATASRNYPARRAPRISSSPSCRATRWTIPASTPPRRYPPAISAVFMPLSSMAGRTTSRRSSISSKADARTPLAWRGHRQVSRQFRRQAFSRRDAASRSRQGPGAHRLLPVLDASGDTAPIGALADALAARGLEVTAIFVASLKDAEAIAFIRAELARERPDVIVNTTAFSARLDAEAGVLDGADAPVLQAILAGATEAQWRENPRGLGAADLAMNVVLPEMDGRLITRAIACKAEAEHRADLEFTPRVHRASAIAHKFCRGPRRRLGQACAKHRARRAK